MENLSWIVLAIISIVAAMSPFRSQIMNFLQKIKLPKFTMHSVIWIVFFACLGIISLAIGCGFWGILYGIAKGLSKWCDIGMPSIWTIPIVASIPFIGMTIRAVIKSIEKIPQTYHCLVEVCGKYVGKQLNPGIHFKFPFYDFVEFRGIEKNEIRMPFFLKGEKVELQDANVEIEGCFFFKVVDPIKAAYIPQNYKTDTRKKMASALKSLVGKFTLEDIRVMRANATVDDILNSDADGLSQKTSKTVNKQLEDCELWKKFRDDWGIEILDAAISEIKLPPEIETAINAVSKAGNEAKAAIFKKKEAIIKAEGEKVAAILKAEGEKQAELLKGEGEAERIESLKKTGLEPDEATALMAQLSRNEAIKPTDKTVFDVNTDSISGLGAKLGAGMNSTNKP